MKEGEKRASRLSFISHDDHDFSFSFRLVMVSRFHDHQHLQHFTFRDYNNTFASSSTVHHCAIRTLENTKMAFIRMDCQQKYFNIQPFLISPLYHMRDLRWDLYWGYTLDEDDGDCDSHFLLSRRRDALRSVSQHGRLYASVLENEDRSLRIALVFS